MEILLNEGNEVTVRARCGTVSAYRVLVCRDSCILTKQEADAVKKKG